ncbi:MAG: hypothetical protein ABWX90_02255 [Candidatus Saccharimonadales bacterium]
MERTAETDAPTIVEASIEQLRDQVGIELRATWLHNMQHDRRREVTPVVNDYRLPVTYNPEDVAPVKMAPICEPRRWWMIPDTKHYGMTDSPSLTITDPNGLPCPIKLARHKISRSDMVNIIHGLRKMREPKEGL